MHLLTQSLLPKLFTAAVSLTLPSTALAEPSGIRKFSFGSDTPPASFTAVPRAAVYSADTGFGFEEDPSSLTQLGKAVVAKESFLFSVAVPEGIYDVTVGLGGVAEPATVSVKAEAARLMLHDVPVAADSVERRTFTVAVKSPRLASGSTLKLKPSQPPLNWDDKLTLEFNGPAPAVAFVEIAPAKDPVTVFIAGDSTVTDQAGSIYSGWGQVIPRFFQPGVAVFNNAQSGDSLRSFRGGLLDQIWERAKPGDYLFIQFGHNDQKDKSEGAGPFTTYKQFLVEYVAKARELHMKPVLVTSMERRRFKNGKAEPTLADYAEAVRQVGKEQNVPVIDLNAASLKLYDALGEKRTERAFVHYAAGTAPDGRPEAMSDNTHFDNYGAHQLARVIATGIHELKLDLAGRLATDFKPFDPSKPDDIDTLAYPRSPAQRVAKPEGN